MPKIKTIATIVCVLPMAACDWIPLLPSDPPTDPGGNPSMDAGVVPDDLHDEVIADCATHEGYRVFTQTESVGGEQALYVASVYETQPNDPWDHCEEDGEDDCEPTPTPMGHASLDFALPGNNTLALIAHDPTTWHVQVVEDGRIDRILTFSHNEQVVVAPPGIPVERRDGVPRCHPEPFLSDDGRVFDEAGHKACHREAEMDAAEQASGVPLRRYDHCYQASSFRWQVASSAP